MSHHFFQGVLYGAVRSFCMAIMATIGIFLGIFIFILMIGGISTTTTNEIDQKYNVEILPNAEGIRKSESNKSPVILQLNIKGIIGTELLNTETINNLLVESREGDLKNDRVKAILLYINTPGGTVTDSDGIYRAIKSYKEKYKVPVYAFADGLCASGGMYVACAADKVFANDVSLIGSIGVLGPSFMNFSKLIEKVGVDSLTISEGKGKDAMNPLRPWKPDEDENFKKIIKYYYEMFVDIVASSRPSIGKEKLVETYGAGVFPAELAAKYGYIDANNHSREDVLKLLLKELGIEDTYYQVVQLESSNWVTKLFSSKNSLLKGEIKHSLNLPEEIETSLSNKYLYLYSPNRG